MTHLNIQSIFSRLRVEVPFQILTVVGYGVDFSASAYWRNALKLATTITSSPLTLTNVIFITFLNDCTA